MSMFGSAVFNIVFYWYCCRENWLIGLEKSCINDEDHKILDNQHMCCQKEGISVTARYIYNYD